MDTAVTVNNNDLGYLSKLYSTTTTSSG
jgi:hypothetical protein